MSVYIPAFDCVIFVFLRESAASSTFNMCSGSFGKVRSGSGQTSLPLVCVDAASLSLSFYFCRPTVGSGKVSPLSGGSQQLAATGEGDTRRLSLQSA